MAVTAAIAAAPWVFAGWPTRGDLPSHVVEVRTLAAALRHGELTAWCDGPNLGYPLVLAYQPGPTVVAAAVVAALGDAAAPAAVLGLAALAWALTPLAWWRGGRALGLSARGAIAAGLLAPAVADPDGFGLGLASLARSGLVSQAWAGALLPLAWGGLVRLGREGRGAASAMLATAALIVCHPVIAGFGVMAAGISVAVGPAPHRRLVAVALGVAALVTAWWWVPMLRLLPDQGGLLHAWPIAGGDGAGHALAATARGVLTDGDRVPWLGALALIGLGLALRRGRGALGVDLVITGVVTVALLAGCSRLVPGGSLEPVRLVAGVHAVAIVAAALAIDAGLAAAQRLVTTPRAATTLTAVVAALALLHVAARAAVTRALLTPRPPLAELAALARALPPGDGRIMTMADLGTRSVPYLAVVPALAGRPPLLSQSRGFHDSASTAYVMDFEPSAAGLTLYGVDAIVARTVPSPLPSHLRESWRDRDHAVLTPIAPAPRLHLVAATRPLVASRAAAVAVLRDIAPRLFASGALPVVCRGCVQAPGGRAIDGAAPGAAQALLADAAAAGAGGPVGDVVASRQRGGALTADVDVRAGTRPVLAVASISYHPWWRVTIDGVPAPTLRVGPALLAVEVPPGRHHVAFAFRAPWPVGAAALLSLALAAIAAVALSRRAGRWGR